MKFQVNITGIKPIINKINFRVKRYERSRQYMFADPLARTLNFIKKGLTRDVHAKRKGSRKGGKINPKNYRGPLNHIFTGRMYNNVKAKMFPVSFAETQVYFGTWVPYGYIFEIGGFPRYEPLSRLRPWALHRFGDEKAAYPVHKKIRRIGSDGYPIVTRTWKGNKKNYTDIAMRRFAEILLT